MKVTDPVKWSPGRTALPKFTGNAANISYQPKYLAWPPLQSTSLPVCSTVWLPKPSRPTQKLEKVRLLVQCPVGSTQLAEIFL